MASDSTRPVERRDWRATKRAFHTYDPMPPAARGFALARYAIAPLGPLTTELGDLRGRALSLGSGLCMVERYLTEMNPHITFEGIDLDAEKHALIAATQHLSPRVTLTLGDATDLSGQQGYDAILVCDALHHLPLDGHVALAEAMYAALTPGGVLIVKDLDVGPRWKFVWNRVHDRIIAGPGRLSCRSVDAMARLLESAGFDIERAGRTERSWEPYAHYLIRARRPA